MALRDQETKLDERRQPPPGPVTYEEFLEWADEDTHAEWVDGQVILMPVTVAERHALILSFLTWLFNQVTRLGQLGGVYGEPFQMRLPALRRGRAPDLFFVRSERRDLMRRHYMHGPADLVVEIVSPESVRRDRIEKLAEYEEAGVPEYWLIDPERADAEFRVRGPDGRYRVAFSGTTGLYQSTVLPQLRLRIEWLWQEPGPDMDAVLRELGQPSA
jgi:Uma2 family endonuclease